MTKPPDSVIDTAIAKAERSPDFTAGEIEALKSVADAWRGLRAFGRLAGLVKTIVIYLGWMIGLYLAARWALEDWARGIRP